MKTPYMYRTCTRLHRRHLQCQAGPPHLISAWSRQLCHLRRSSQGVRYGRPRATLENHVEVWLSRGAYLCSSETLHRHKRSRLHFVRGSKEEAARVSEEAKSHFETGRCSEGNGFSARHSNREYGYYEQFRGFRSGPERPYQ